MPSDEEARLRRALKDLAAKLEAVVYYLEASPTRDTLGRIELHLRLLPLSSLGRTECSPRPIPRPITSFMISDVPP